MSKQTGEWEWARERPPQRPLWHRTALLLYNPANRSVLGRDARRWGILLLFYGVFYVGLALLFGACWGGLMLTLNDEAPRHKLAASLIGDSPGVSARPRAELLVANHSHDLAEFLRPYEAAAWFRALEGCKADDAYGGTDAPCIYVKVNRIFSWEPQYLDVLPDEAPADLRAYVAALAPNERRQVWVSCAAEGGGSEFSYPWGRGLPERFFPYRNQREYLSPLVAVRVRAGPPGQRPRAVRCRAWARNVRHDPSMKEPRGYARVTLS